MRVSRAVSIISCVVLLVGLLAYPACVSATSDGVLTRRGYAVAPDSEGWASYNAQGVYYAFISKSIYSSYYLNVNDSSSVILQNITSFFSGSDDDDVNYLYLSGHGNSSGINLGDGVSYSNLKQALDTVPGHFILFIQSCESGGAIDGESDSLSNDSVSTEQKIINNFLYGCENPDLSNLDGAFDGVGKYTVFCSALSYQSSYHEPNDGLSYVTMQWMKGIGYNIKYLYTCTEFADTNGDGIVTAKELQDYAVLETSSTPCYYSQYYFYTITTSDYVLGDVNQDGAISLGDVLKIMQYLSNMTTLTSRQLELADVSGDGYVTDVDRQYLQYYIAGANLV